MLFPTLAPPSCCVIAEPKLLLLRVRRVCALAAHMGQIDLTALESAPALTDALFDPPCLLPFLQTNCPTQCRGLCCLHGLRNLIFEGCFCHVNSLCVVDELVRKTAKKFAITSLLVAIMNNMLIDDVRTSHQMA